MQILRLLAESGSCPVLFARIHYCRSLDDADNFNARKTGDCSDLFCCTGIYLPPLEGVFTPNILVTPPIPCPPTGGGGGVGLVNFVCTCELYSSLQLASAPAIGLHAAVNATGSSDLYNTL
jgi:hypothetical protein